MTAPHVDAMQECLACGKPLGKHGVTDDCPMFIADGALSYREQLATLADLNGWKARAEAAEARNARLTEALEFYANPEIYRPHPHGSAFDRRDLSDHARAALRPQEGS